MQRSVNSPSRFRSSISALVFACGCTDVCGIAGAPVDGIVAANGEVSAEYGRFVARPDDPSCPLAIHGAEVGAVDGAIDLCLHDPHAAPDGGLALTALAGAAMNCTFALDPAAPVGGTAHAEHFCDGDHPFALVIDATATLARTCATGDDATIVTLRGRVAVEPQ